MCKTEEIFPAFPYTEKYYEKVRDMSHEDRLDYNVLNVNEFEGLVLGGDRDYPGPKVNYICESVVRYFDEFYRSRSSYDRGAYQLSEMYKYRLHGFCYALDMVCDFYEDCVKFISYKHHKYVNDPKTHIPTKTPFVFYIRPNGQIYYTQEGEI